MERRGAQSHPIPDGIDGRDSQTMTALFDVTAATGIHRPTII